jgi:nucleoid-associated protein YgaU
MTFADYLVWGATCVLRLCAVWATAGCAALMIELLSRGRLPATTWVGCPAPLRRAVLAALGIALATGGAAVASPMSSVPAALRGPDSRSGLGLPVPDRPTGSSYALPGQRVEVKPGDSLWRLAREQSRRASTQDLARLVSAAYRHNRRVIGPDPDLIRPGQRLQIPRQRTSHEEAS